MTKSTLYTNEDFWIDMMLILFQHVAIYLAVFLFFDIPAPLLAVTRDSENYIELANAILTGNYGVMDTLSRQYFIGFPIVLSLFFQWMEPWIAINVIHILSTLSLYWVLRKLFQNPWIPRYFLLCVPTYVFCTLFITTEPFFILLLFSILYLSKTNKTLAAAALIGLATIVRPQATLFLFLPLMGWFLMKRDRQAVIYFILFPALFLIGMLKFNAHAFGDPWINFIKYDAAAENGILWLPFQNLIVSTFNSEYTLWKKVYVWLYVVLALLGMGFLARKGKREGFDFLSGICLIWAGLHFLFYVSVGSWWGFHSMHRYLLPIIPVALFSLRDYLPKRWSVVLVLTIACTIFVILAEVT